MVGQQLRILIYGINYAPELTGIGKYTGEMAKWLASQGHIVKIITAKPYYPEWKIDKKYKRKLGLRNVLMGSTYAELLSTCRQNQIPLNGYYMNYPFS